MQLADRLERTVSLVNTRGYITVKELTDLFSVSEVTVRRDLNRLHKEQRLRRTSGGAASLEAQVPVTKAAVRGTELWPLGGNAIDQVDVLIVSAGVSAPDPLLLEPAVSRGIPIVAEAVELPDMATLVSVDNYGAGIDLGHWAGHYAREHFDGQASILDLTYDMFNTQQRSQGFVDGIKEVLSDTEVCLSANSQAHFKTAYQLTTDALSVHPHINIIFAINDVTAYGACRACEDLDIDPSDMLILPFGLEGDIMRSALAEGSYCKAGLAMFPEVVGRECIAAAIAVYNGVELDPSARTPHVVLTSETLSDYYEPTDRGWQIQWDAVKHQLTDLLELENQRDGESYQLPAHVRFVVPFAGHEWYQNLAVAMRAYAHQHRIELEVISTSQTLQEELILRRRTIGRIAARLVKPGDVIILDHSEITTYLAEELRDRQDITVITNSLPVFELLCNRPGLELILTGGLLGEDGAAFFGPTTALVLRELCADKLFLSVDGISLDFGLSHSVLEAVPVKRAMLQSAKETILLADHTRFKHSATAHIAPITEIQKLITDNALPASVRLELRKRGVEVTLRLE